MKVYERKNFPRTSRDLKSMYERGILSFDNAVQRRFVWKNTLKDNRMSMLIDSIIRGLPVPAMYCNCIFSDPKNKIYDFIDGKQRSLTIIKFINDEFRLIGIPTFELEDGEEIDINGKCFSELPQEFQEKVLLFNFTVNYYENMEQDDVDEMFRRLNNGRSLASIDLIRATAKSKTEIRKLASHDIFKSMLNDNAIAARTNEDIVIKSWILLFGPESSFLKKDVDPIMKSAVITEEEMNTIISVYDRFLEILNQIKGDGSRDNLRVYRKITKKTNFVSLVPIVYASIQDEITVDEISQWMYDLFSPKKETTTNESYNTNAAAGSAKLEAIKIRKAALNNEYSIWNRHLSV